MKKCPLCEFERYKRLYVVGGLDIVECNKCGLARTLNPKNYSYEKYHRNDAEYTKDEKIFENIFKKRYKNISKFVKSPGMILDIGASTGTLLKVFKENGWDVWGVEPSRSADFAKKRGIKMTKASFENAKLPKNYFDVVVMNHTLEHVNDPLKVLKKINTLLKKDGIVYIDVPNFGGLDSRLKKEKWGYLMPEEHTFHYTKETLINLFKAAGLSVVWVKTWSGIFDVGNPFEKFWYDLTHFRLAFFKDMVKVPFNVITTLSNRGSSLAVVGKKD